jgi:hypothetical protein
VVEEQRIEQPDSQRALEGVVVVVAIRQTEGVEEEEEEPKFTVKPFFNK